MVVLVIYVCDHHFYFASAPTAEPEKLPLQVWFKSSTEILVGKKAEDAPKSEARNVVSDVSKLLGRRFSNPGIQAQLTKWPFSVINANGLAAVDIRGTAISSIQILSHVFVAIKRRTEEITREIVRQAVIILPLPSSRLEAVTEAAELAGIRQLHFVSTDIGCVLNASCKNNNSLDGWYLLLKFRSGYLRASLSKVNSKIISLRHSQKIQQCKLQDVDDLVVGWCLEQFGERTGEIMGEKDTNEARKKLQKSWTRKQMDFANSESVTIALPKFWRNLDWEIDFSWEVFVSIIRSWLQNCYGILQNMLLDFDLQQIDLAKVVVVRSSQIVSRLVVNDYFQGKHGYEVVGPRKVVRAVAGLNFQDIPHRLLDMRGESGSSGDEDDGAPLEKEEEALLEEDVSEDDGDLMRPPVLGIDFGTTYSCVAVNFQEEIQVVFNTLNEETTPSYVLFQDDENSIVGRVAKDMACSSPATTIYDVKRMLGKNFGDPNLKHFLRMWPFKVQDVGGQIKICMEGHNYSPEEIVTIIMSYLKSNAESQIGENIKNAVVAVPVHFQKKEEELLKAACQASGFKRIKFVKEPFAAALAFSDSFRSGDDLNRKIQSLIFDLGGGTFDVAVCSMLNGKVSLLAVDGDAHLGGEDFDEEMIYHCIQEFRKKHGIDLLQEGTKAVGVRMKLARLRQECEKVKCYLSAAKSYPVCVYAIHGTQDLDVLFTQELFNALIEKYLLTCRNILVRAVTEKTNLSLGDINEIVLVGGSSKIPRVRHMLKGMFPTAKILHGVNPDHAVAIGAASCGRSFQSLLSFNQQNA